MRLFYSKWIIDIKKVLGFLRLIGFGVMTGVLIVLFDLPGLCTPPPPPPSQPIRRREIAMHEAFLVVIVEDIIYFPEIQ